MLSDPEKFDTDYEIGQDNLQKFGMDVHHPVFWVAAILVILFVMISLISPEQAKGAFEGAKGWSIDNFDWLFMVGGNIFVIFCLALIFLPVGKIRLGGYDAKPEFSTISWFSMLFAAGMGIGLMFWSVAEPVAYYTDWWGTPLNVAPNTPEGASAAMGATMFHWGLHPWAIYAVVALSLAFFTYNKGLPLTLRSAFYPLIGDKSWGFIGHVVDTVAVVATLFGLATSLGFGAQQAASGLNFLFDVPKGIGTETAVILGVTFVALMSVLRGLDGGVKVLSNINMSLAGLLMLFVIIFGPTLAILSGIFTTAGAYVENIFSLSNWIGREDDKFYHGWTVFYWAWWISWSPFVGMFIARVSRGRTVREFVTCVLLIPSLVCILWMAVFGGAAIEQVFSDPANSAVKAQVIDSYNPPMSLFAMLEGLPMASITSVIAIVLVIVFFVTSSDSGSLVIDTITAGGKVDAPVPQRVFWCIFEGAVAIVLLLGGGLGALQAMVISTGLPFTLVLLVMCFAIWRGLRAELKL